MRRTTAGLLGALGIVLAIQGAALGAPEHHTDQRLERATAPVPAVPSDSIVDGYGVGIHLNFLDTPYYRYDLVADALADLGVRHVRDDLFLDSPRQYRAIRAVADRGIGFDLIMGRPDSGATPADYVRTVAEELPAGAVESLEGANEWDLFGGDGWDTEVRSWQEQLYAAAEDEPATADLPVLSPALAFRWNYADVGDLSPWADLANAHMYPGGYEPSNEIGRITEAVRQALPNEPLVTTEAGYNNAMNSTGSHKPVPEDVAGAYAPRLLLEHLRRGEQRMYGYELIDSFDDPGLENAEAHFGLLRHDLSPKPAYTAMKNLLSLVADPGPDFGTDPLAITADGLPGDARYLLTERRDGRYVLLLWRNVRIYDPDRQQYLPVTPADVTVRLEEPHDLSVYRPSDGSTPVRTRTGSSTVPVALDGQVTAVTIDPPTPPAPTHVTAEPGAGRATLHWDLPSSAVAVTGFEVTRSPGGEPVPLPADARSYADAGLVNGRAYDYTVRTIGENGPSAVAATTVVPAAVPGRPRIVRAVGGRGKVRVVWRPADGRGRPVTAYRVQAGGRTVTVGPGATRATIRRLPRHHRVLVTVRAQNEMGWGRPTRTHARTR